jgi:hypothetical protein
VSTSFESRYPLRISDFADDAVLCPRTFRSSSRPDTAVLYVVVVSCSIGQGPSANVVVQDYIYSLLTGYVDPPPGVTVAEGMNYNP